MCFESISKFRNFEIEPGEHLGRFKRSDFFIPNVRISGSVNTESIWSLQTCVMWTSVRFSRVFLYLVFAAYDST